MNSRGARDGHGAGLAHLYFAMSSKTLVMATAGCYCRRRPRVIRPGCRRSRDLPTPGPLAILNLDYRSHSVRRRRRIFQAFYGSMRAVSIALLPDASASRPDRNARRRDMHADSAQHHQRSEGPAHIQRRTGLVANRQRPHGPADSGCRHARRRRRPPPGAVRGSPGSSSAVSGLIRAVGRPLSFISASYDQGLAKIGRRRTNQSGPALKQPGNRPLPGRHASVVGPIAFVGRRSGCTRRGAHEVPRDRRAGLSRPAASRRRVRQELNFGWGGRRPIHSKSKS